MNLRRKTLLILGLVLIGAIVIILGLSYTVLLGSYATFEDETVRDSSFEAIKAINSEISLLELKCSDWSRWDETYLFISGEDSEYVQRNLIPETIDNLGIDVFLFINQSRQLVYATGYNKSIRQRIPLPDEYEEDLLSSDYLFSHDQAISSRTGIISVGNVPLMVVSEPVLKSTYEGPPAGFLIFGKYLDTDEIHKLSDATSLNLTIFPSPEFSPDYSEPTVPDIAAINKGNNSSVVIRIINQETIAGYSIFPGIPEDETFVIQVTHDRRVYNQGLQTIGSFIALLVIIGLFFIVTALITIDRLVLRRLTILINRARSRNVTSDDVGDPLFKNGDELSELSRSLTPVFDDYSRSIQELRESERKYRELAGIVHHTQTGIITGMLDKIDVINPAYALMHGYTPEEIVEIPAYSLFSPDLRKAFPGYLQKAEALGHVVFEAEHIHRDGTAFPTLNDLTAISEPEGAGTYWILNVQDITEHRLAWKILMESESLRESHRQLRDVISRLPDATFVIDKDGWVILWNTAMEHLTGISADDIVGRGNYEYSIPFYGEKRPLLIDFVINSSLDPGDRYPEITRIGDTLSLEEYLPVTVNGPMYLSSVASPLYDSKGRIIGSIESIRDISARKRVEETLMKTNEKLNLLSSITRHDIRNRITIFFGILPLITKMSADPDIADMVHLLEKAAGAIRDQIEFSRDYQDMGVHAPEWRDTSVMFDRTTYQGVPSEVKAVNKLNGLFIYADPLLERVFYNLIDNTLRHGGEVSLITASYLSNETGIVIIYEDNGTGIPDDLKEKVFERGYGKNTGLGLFLVRQILAITGISIHETGIFGTGVRFEMKVPEGCYRIEQSSK